MLEIYLYIDNKYFNDDLLLNLEELFNNSCNYLETENIIKIYTDIDLTKLSSTITELESNKAITDIEIKEVDNILSNKASNKESQQNTIKNNQKDKQKDNDQQNDKSKTINKTDNNNNINNSSNKVKEKKQLLVNYLDKELDNIFKTQEVSISKLKEELTNYNKELFNSELDEFILQDWAMNPYNEQRVTLLSLLNPYWGNKTKTINLNEAKALLKSSNNALIAFSDIHGQYNLIEEAYNSLDLYNPEIRKKHKLLSIGDFADGRNPGDASVIEKISNDFDIVLAGNHEAAILGGGSFNGLQTGLMQYPETPHLLKRMVFEGRLDAAYSFNDVIYSHAGVHNQWNLGDNPEDIVNNINEKFIDWSYRTSNLHPELFTIDKYRGSYNETGGVFWSDFRSFKDNNNEFQQIVGHTPGALLQDFNNINLIDVGGYRLGISIQIDKEIFYTSTLNIVD